MDSILNELTAANLLAIFFLIFLEGILSFDNALALAALVKSKLKDPIQQKKALTYGIWGAYFFRVVVVFCGVWLMQFWQVKLGAGAYLVWLGTSELLPKTKEKHEKEIKGFNIKWLTPLWSTIISVEIMDLMFSIDSIGVALAISNVKWVLISGAILGILMMRVAASLFIKLIDRYPILEKTAFLLVLIAGIGVGLKAFHIEIPEVPFIVTLIGILLGSIYINHIKPVQVMKFLEKTYG
jgi:YkoY family integral membrane protein